MPGAGDHVGSQASQGPEGDKVIKKMVEDKDSNVGDPQDRGKVRKWTTLFGVRPSVHSGLLEVKNLSDLMKGVFSISVPNKLVYFYLWSGYDFGWLICWF